MEQQRDQFRIEELTTLLTLKPPFPFEAIWNVSAPPVCE
jgi:hypothetical protein